MSVRSLITEQEIYAPLRYMKVLHTHFSLNKFILHYLKHPGKSVLTHKSCSA